MENDYRAIKYLAIVILGGFVFGLDAAVVSGTIRYISMQFELSSLEVGTVVGAPSIGAIIALFVAGKLTAVFGRQKTLVLIAFTYVISAILSATALGYYSLVFARALGGLAFCSLGITSMYIGEVAPSHVRGKLMTANQVTTAFGFFSAYLINYFLVLSFNENSVFLGPETIWRTMFAVEIIPAIIWFLLLLKVPESPRWLMMKGRPEDARKVLKLLNAPDNVEIIHKEIQQNIKSTSATLSVTAQLRRLASKRMSIIVLVGVTAAITQSLSGINAIAYYSPTIFEQIGLGVNEAFKQTSIMGMLGILAAGTSVFLVDKVGRKPLLVVGLSAIAICHFTIWNGFQNATYVVTEEKLAAVESTVDVEPLKSLLNKEFSSDRDFKVELRDRYDANFLRANESNLIKSFIQISAGPIVAAIFAFKIAFGFSIGPMMWVLFSEITPNSVRSVAIPCFALMSSLSAWASQKFFPWQLEVFGSATTFLSYGIFALLGMAVLVVFLIETKNRSIEEIESLMARGERIPSVTSATTERGKA
ncbi:MFS transporter [Vibrio sp. 10N.261.51.F12]|uniref:MFS transporter n=1 Tax=Vibrio sp. 10N.261.51.F12 TaxID=3229679 RepID=UPI003551A94B